MSGVLVDACVWSVALRSRTQKEATAAERLTQLIDNNQARLIGPIRQELLSGYTDENSFERLRQKIEYFPNEPIIDADYVSAEYSNFCRAKGIQGSHTDFLICAVSIRAKFYVYTTDKDFHHYAKHLPISLL